MTKPINTLSSIVTDHAIRFSKETLNNPRAKLALTILASMAGLGIITFPKTALQAGYYVIRIGTDPRFLGIIGTVFSFADKLIAQRQIAERDKQLEDGGRQITNLTEEVANLKGLLTRQEEATKSLEEVVPTLKGLTTDAKTELLALAQTAKCTQDAALESLKSAKSERAAAESDLTEARAMRAEVRAERTQNVERLEQVASRLEAFSRISQTNPMLANLAQIAMASHIAKHNTAAATA